MIPVLPDEFTRADLAALVNGAAVVGYLGLALIVMLLAVIAGRGK